MKADRTLGAVVKRVMSTATLAAATLFSAAAQAQAFPAKPIRLIIPYAPGGSTDVLGRLYGARLQELLGQTVLVENKGGGGTLIGIRAAAQAPADGYSMLYTTSAVAINPVMYRNPGYKLDDFAVVGPGGQFPYVLLAHASVPAKNIRELVAYAKANPGKLNYGSLGKGSPTQLLSLRLLGAAGIEAVEIGYAGSGPANKDLMGGNVQLLFIGATAANLKSGLTHPLAVASDQRLSFAPDVGTFKEAGYPSMVGGTWFGFFAPAKTPGPALQRLAKDVEQASRDLRDKLATMGVDSFPGKTEEFPAYIKSDQALWEKDIKRLGLQLDE
jgi:tripartite-type tricarboxylate transporter receptor subunit TctC